MIDAFEATQDVEKLDYVADLEYIVAERLGVDVEDLERCPKSVYDALLRYFDSLM